MKLGSKPTVLSSIMKQITNVKLVSPSPIPKTNLNPSTNSSPSVIPKPSTSTSSQPSTSVNTITSTISKPNTTTSSKPSTSTSNTTNTIYKPSINTSTGTGSKPILSTITQIGTILDKIVTSVEPNKNTDKTPKVGTIIDKIVSTLEPSKKVDITPNIGAIFDKIVSGMQPKSEAKVNIPVMPNNNNIEVLSNKRPTYSANSIMIVVPDDSYIEGGESIEVKPPKASKTKKPISKDEILSFGDKGKEVDKLQDNLKVLGYFNYKSDSLFGIHTEDAVKAFQSDHGLKDDGRVGDNTKAAIAKAMKGDILNKGDRGDNVEKLQKNLRGLGYFEGDTTEYFGDKTLAAVKKFQDAHGLKEDGKVREKTRKAIDEAVEKVQRNLKELKYYKDTVDGDFGNNTRKAVIAFQKDYGLEHDGVVDKDTRKAIKRAMKGEKPKKVTSPKDKEVDIDTTFKKVNWLSYDAPSELYNAGDTQYSKAFQKQIIKLTNDYYNTDSSETKKLHLQMIKNLRRQYNAELKPIDDWNKTVEEYQDGVNFALLVLDPEIGAAAGAAKLSTEFRGLVAVDKEIAASGVVKYAGKLSGAVKEIEKDEWLVVNDWLAEGKSVEKIAKDPKAIDPTYDFVVNGVKIEVKTLNGTSLGTPIKRIAEGFEQGAETVVIDARKTSLTVEEAQNVINRAAGKYKNKVLPGKVEIWTNQGILATK